MAKIIIEIFTEGLTDYKNENAIEHKLIDIIIAKDSERKSTNT